MRDPDLVQRAERAATALERAWIHWRTMHGLGSDPLPPVSSYVGYSLEEPWGQPRVVFGVGAEEAERLAALLDGHDCVGPIHAEVTSRPEWRYGPGLGNGRALDEPLRIPAQAPQPLADMFPPGSYDGAAIDGAPVEKERADSTAGSAPDDEAAGVADEDDRFAPAAALDSDVDDLYLASADTQGEHREPGSTEPGSTEPGSTEQLPALPPPGTVAFRRRPEQLPDSVEEGAPFAAAPIATSGHDVAPTHGPGYRGPRYQGSPPQYRSGPSRDPASSDDAAAPAEDRDVPVASAEPARSKSRQLSKRGRTRRQGPGAHEAWDSADERSATDHAV